MYSIKSLALCSLLLLSCCGNVNREESEENKVTVVVMKDNHESCWITSSTVFVTGDGTFWTSLSGQDYHFSPSVQTILITGNSENISNMAQNVGVENFTNCTLS